MGRESVLTNQSVALRVVLEDSQGNMVDPDQAPAVYIYDSTYDEEDIEAEYDAAVFTGLGPFLGTLIAPGYYEYVFTVPVGATAGDWHDLWISERADVDSHDIFSFTVVDTTTITVQRLLKNSLIVITLDSTIADTDGNALDEDIQLTFSTTYDPLYASVDLLRAEIGPWIDFIPDDTINLLLHWSSLTIDQMVPNTFTRRSTTGCGDGFLVFNSRTGTNADRFVFARTMFVIYDAATRALLLPGAANSANVTGMGQTKRLGDLSITGPSGGFGGGALTMEQISELKKNRAMWLRVCNARGAILPGEGLGPTSAVKGFMDPDRRRAGRLWDPTDQAYYPQPTTNGKYRRCGTRRYKFGYVGN